MGARHRLAGCLGLAAVLWAQPVAPQSQTLDPKARLEAAREALMEQALDAPARVEATSWIDEGGRLREAARITSRFNVPRGFLRDSVGQGAQTGAQAGAVSPQPQPQPVAATGPVGSAGRTGPSGSTSPTSPPMPTNAPAQTLGDASTPLCRGPGGLRRLALLSFEPPRVGDPADAALAHGMIQGLESALLAQAAADSAWAVQSRSTPVDAYERLLGLGGVEGAPYRLRVAFTLEPIDPRAGVRDGAGLDRLVDWAGEQWQRAVAVRTNARPEQRVTLAFEVFEPASGERLFVQVRQFIAPALPVSYGVPSLPVELQAVVQSLARALWSDLSAAFACRPIQFSAMPADDGRLTLPVGARAGLRVGDQLFVSDRTRVPSRVLEAGSLERTALFEVVRLGEDQAVLAQMAGPKLERGVPWVAMPL